MRVLLPLLLIVCYCTAATSYGQDLSNYGKKRPSPVTSPKKKKIKKDDRLVTKFNVNLGVHTEFYNAVQVNSSGKLRQFDTAPVIGGGLTIPVNEDFVFLPELNWVLPRTSGKVMKNLFMVRGDLGYSPLDWFRLRLGTSLMWLNMHGKGGSAEINNGNGTSTFYYPDENRSALNSTIDVGAEVIFDQVTLRLQTYTYALFNEERRQLSYTLFVSYFWDR